MVLRSFSCYFLVVFFNFKIQNTQEKTFLKPFSSGSISNAPTTTTTTTTRFPFFEFYGSNESKKFNDKVKPNSCISYNSNDPNRCCSCHDSCVKLNNCCVDKFWSQTENETLASYFQRFVELMNRNVSRYQCNPIFESDLLKSIEGSSSVRYMMISNCHQSHSSSTNDDDFIKCTSSNYTTMLESLPVWSQRTGDLYRSASCARCNNVNSYIPLNITIDCNNKIDYLNDLDGKGCKFKFPTLDFKTLAFKTLAPFQCFYQYKRTTCANLKFKKECNSFTAPVSGLHANYYCLKCSSDGTSKKFDFDAVLKNLSSDCTHTVTLTSWSILLDFSGKLPARRAALTEGIDNHGDASCTPGEMFDVFTQSCSGLDCGSEYNQTGYHECVMASTDRKFKNGKPKQGISNIDRYLEIESYITYIITSISIIGYVLVVFTFLRFKQLQNVPGLNALAMCTSLLFADVLFFVDHEKTWISL